MPRRRPQSTQKADGSLTTRSPLTTHTVITQQGRLRPRYTSRSLAAAAFLATSYIVLVCWFCLKPGPNMVEAVDVEVEHADSPTCSASSPIRISSDDHANITQFFPCISDVSIPPYLSEIDPILDSNRSKTSDPKYDSLMCAPLDIDKCFRGVYDGFDDLVSDTRKDDDPGVVRSIQDRIAVLLESLILRAEEASISPEFGSGRKKPIGLENIHPKLISNDRSDGSSISMHTDYFEDQNLVYTAILYGDSSEDLLGAETYLVDFTTEYSDLDDSYDIEKAEFGMKLADDETDVLFHDKASKTNDVYHINNRLVEFTSGMIIEPKPGRLLLFTTGAENFHGAMDVKRGTRHSFVFWYHCQGMPLF